MFPHARSSGGGAHAQQQQPRTSMRSSHGHGHGGSEASYDSDSDAASQQSDGDDAMSGSERDDAEAGVMSLIEAASARVEVYNKARVVRDICEMNGLTAEHFARKPHECAHLDMFMGRVEPTASLSHLAHFSGLTSLCIMKCSGIAPHHLTGVFGALRNLHTLWFTECQLTDGALTYIKECGASLTKLDLSANKLTLTHAGDIAAMQQLTNLRTLWLNDNGIEHLGASLEPLRGLECLWVCGNRLRAIGMSLQQCSGLREVNLAGNDILTFRDILNINIPIRGSDKRHHHQRPSLGGRSPRRGNSHHHHQSPPKQSSSTPTRNGPSSGSSSEVGEEEHKKQGSTNSPTARGKGMGRAKGDGDAFSLTLKDPHFGSNPVCSLSNYHTYVVYHLPRLTVLDGVEVTNESKVMAMAVYVKKKMYYNMRVKTIKRDATNVTTRARDITAHLTTSFNARMRAHLVALRSEQAATACSQQQGPPVLNGGGWAEEDPEAYSAQMRDLSESMRSIVSSEVEVNTMVEHACKLSVSRVMVEFDTGGNVRLEEGIAQQPASATTTAPPSTTATHTGSSGAKGKGGSSSNSASNSNTTQVPPLGKDSTASSASANANVWFSSCVDLIRARFRSDAPLFRELGIIGVQVNRVIKVHNRGMKHSFETHVKERMAATEAPEKHGQASWRGSAGSNGSGAGRSAAQSMTTSTDDESDDDDVKEKEGNENDADASGSDDESDDRAARRRHRRLSRGRGKHAMDKQPGVSGGNGSRSAAGAGGRSPIEYLLYSDGTTLHFDGRGGPQSPTSSGKEVDHRRGAIRVAQEGFSFARGTHSAPAPRRALSTNEDGGEVFASPRGSSSNHIELDASLWRADGARLAALVNLRSERAQRESPLGSNSKQESGTHGRARAEPRERRLLHGELVIVKAFTGSCVDIATAQQRVDRSAGAAAYDGYALGNEASGCRWLFRESKACVPEYIVSYEYIHDDSFPPVVSTPGSANGPLPTVGTAGAGSGGRGEKTVVNLKRLRELSGVLSPIGGKETFLANEFVDYAPFLPYILSHKRYVEACGEVHQIRQPADLSGASADGGCGNGKESHVHAFGEPVGAEVGAESQQQLALTEESICAHAGVASTSEVTVLCMHKIGLQRVEPLSVCGAMVKLVLGNNMITSLDALSKLPCLRYLDVSLNHIKSVSEHCGTFQELRTLDLRFNRITALMNIDTLGLAAPKLSHLLLQGNPTAESRDLRVCAVKTFARLRTLDDAAITETEREVARSITTILSVKHVLSSLRHMHTQCDSCMDAYSHVPTGKSIDLSDVTVLGVNSAKLTNVELLQGMTNLRTLSLAHNAIPHVRDFAKCTGLEELSLEDNCISDCGALASITTLRKLDLSHNSLTHLPALRDMRKLVQVSLQNNSIATLRWFAPLVNAMEVYVGNNAIADLSEIDHLRGLNKLIILDMSGNPACGESEKHRMYALYKLRRLKVLDGISVGTTELNAARELYAGRLTKDLVLEAASDASASTRQDGGTSDGGETPTAAPGIGTDLRNTTGDPTTPTTPASPPSPSSPSSPSPSPSPSAKDESILNGLLTLSLESQRLKEASMLSQMNLTTLREVNLNNNVLTHFSSLLSGLPSLTILQLNGNKVEGCFNMRRRGSNTSDSASMMTLGGGGEDLGGVCESLEVLLLGFNRVKNVSDLCLARLPRLRVLHLQSNLITSMNGIQTCTTLRELVLNKNRIRQLESPVLCGLGVLRELHIQENGLKSLKHINILNSLQSLYAGYNRVGDLAELDHLCDMSNIVNVNLTHNPVAKRQSYRSTVLCNVPSVRWIDGREASAEERERAEMIARSDKPLKFFLQEINHQAAHTNAMPGNNALPQPYANIAHAQAQAHAQAGNPNFVALAYALQNGGRAGGNAGDPLEALHHGMTRGPLPPTHATALSQTPQAPHVGAAHSHTPNHGLALARRVAPNAAHRTATTVSTTHASPRYPGAPGPSKGLQLSGGTSQSHGGGIGNLQVITAPHPSVAAKQNQRAQAQPQTHGHGFGRLRVQPPSETLKSIQVSNSRLSGGGRGGMWPTTQKSTVSSELPPPRAAHAVHASFPSASGSGVGGKKSQGGYSGLRMMH